MAPVLAACGLLVIVAGLMLWLFLPTLDLRLFEAARLASDGGLVIAFTRLGGFAVLAPVALAVTGWLLVRRRTAEAIWLFATILSGRLAVEGLKLLFERTRPPLSGRLDMVTSWSFPSAHAANTMLTLLALAILARRPAFLPFAVALACVMGWTRIALGVHWPGDVLGGLGFGMIWTGLATRWLPERAHYSPD
ncbi:hypothetical protein WP12_18800 [Sphingomonas sp. SRS2]|nr:hypothetical protein WP12_18800 [Sphingomonas sp. SRS2]